MNVPAPGSTTSPAIVPGRLSIVLVSLLFAALHVHALFQGVANLVALPDFYDRLGLGALTPWWLLVVGVVAPPAAFAGAVLLGRRRALSHRVALLTASLGTVNAVALSSGALAPILLALAAGA